MRNPFSNCNSLVFLSLCSELLLHERVKRALLHELHDVEVDEVLLRNLLCGTGVVMPR